MTTAGTRYSARHRIATGGMGEVWLAHDEVLNRDVAVKYLKQEYADDKGFRSRFLNEARSAAALLHPGIATVFDFGEGDDGPPFLVMEYVDGRPLSELLTPGKPLDPERARELVAQAAEALAAAHAAGFVHRDVKPGNLLVTPDGIVKITDFGIARAGDGMALTETGQLIGTPSYISPEQAEGQSATPASDVYALGVVLFECLTGHRPYEADSPLAVALAHIREPVPDLPPEVPADLAAVTVRALAKHPEDRYPDAGAFAAALGALAPEATMLFTAPVVAAPAAAPVVGRLGAGLRIGRNRLPILLTAALALIVLGVVAVVALNSGDGTTKDPASPGPSPSVPRVSASTASAVQVDPVTYVGKPVAEVRAALLAQGLDTGVVEVPNPGGHTAGTVAALRPTGTVPEGATITLDVWGTPPPAAGSGGDDSGKGGNGKGKGKKN